MRKIISFFLFAVTVTVSFVSCSKPINNYSPKITVSSSDAASDAVYLTNRLGVLKDNVYLGIGSDEFDMTDFEDDGYIIRADNGDAVIIGATSEGLANGVRKYANYAEKNQASSLDISYHEGYRVEKFTLAGVDISEYAIEYPETYNENMEYAAGEFVRLTEKACGARLTSSVGITDRKYAIEFRHTSDPELKNNGYRYFFEGSRFVIEGAVKRGCAYGVWRFMKDELDWTGLAYLDRARGLGLADSVLSESEHIDIPSDRYREETSSLDFLSISLNTTRSNDITIPTDKQIAFLDPLPHHGMTINEWGGHDGNGQICYTDEITYNEVLEDIRAYVEKNISAGKKIGEELLSIDLGQSDNGDYCNCNECLKHLSKWRGRSAAVVEFANRISDDMEEDYSGLVYKIFAYMGTNAPTKMIPNDNVYITYCIDRACAKHPLISDECSTKINEIDPMLFGSPLYYENSVYAEWLRGWCELSDNIYVWQYYLNHNMSQYTALDVMYDDMKFFADCNVSGVYFECHNAESMGEAWFVSELICEMNWQPNMTRAEYNAYLHRILEKEFGEGWEYILEYMDIWQRSQTMTVNCWSCWGFEFNVHPGQHDYQYLYDTFDICCDFIERMNTLACDKREIRNCELFSVHMIYEGCLASFFKAYDEGEDERIDVLNERYSLMYDRMKKNNVTTEKIGLYKKLRIFSSLYDEAWTVWAEYRDFLPCGETVRPAPDR